MLALALAYPSPSQDTTPVPSRSTTPVPSPNKDVNPEVNSNPEPNQTDIPLSDPLQGCRGREVN
jgi:hypothetical protein